MRRFGDDSLCVRYRQDEIRGVRLTMVEPIVDRSPWKLDPERIAVKKTVDVRVDHSEM